MGFQPYLCIGGVEIASPTRTLSYLRNVGHGYLRSLPDPSCADCFGNDRLGAGCEIPYAVGAGFDRSVDAEVAAMIFAVFRGAEPVERVGLHREVAAVAFDPMSQSHLSIPPVPTTGWVVSDYADPFTLPLVLSVDQIADCAAVRFERWVVYDIERWPQPATSPPAPGEAAGRFEVLFYIDPCSIDTSESTGRCSVSFDGGETWADMTASNPAGRASGVIGVDVGCTTNEPVSFTLSTTRSATGFCFEFDYVGGGSGWFDVETWLSPSEVFEVAPPRLPIEAGQTTPWSLIGLGSVDAGVTSVHFPPSLCGTWVANQTALYQFWRWTDRVTRASYELVVGIRDTDLSSRPTDWTAFAAYSITGGQTWHAPTDVPVLVTPAAVDEPVPTASVELLVSTPFTTPAADGAPWYDPSVPESADVLGVWIEQFLSPAPYKRDVTDRRWGGILSPPKLQSRELHITGYVYTTTCEATEYARRWLFEAMAAEGCDSCDLPDAVVFRGCDPATDSAQYARTLRRVGLIELNDEVDPEFPCCLGFKFEATMRAEVPYLYGDPVTVYDGPVMDPNMEPICNLCAPCPAIPVMPYSCGCLDAEVPYVFNDPLTHCYCAPARVRRMCVPIDSPGLIWSDATVRLTINVGAALTIMDSEGRLDVPEAIRNMRVVGYPNPLGLTSATVDDADYFACQEPCLDVEVACLPPGAELVVDGSSRRANVTVGPVNLNGYGYLSSGLGGLLQWPDVGCNGLMLCIETDSIFTAPDATLKVELIPRERR